MMWNNDMPVGAPAVDNDSGANMNEENKPEEKTVPDYVKDYQATADKNAKDQGQDKPRNVQSGAQDPNWDEYHAGFTGTNDPHKKQLNAQPAGGAIASSMRAS